MKKTFRPWQVDQSLLLPPSVHDFVPADHPAPFVRALVREELDLSAIVDSYDEARGQPPYDPWMMTALLLYGYSRGVGVSDRAVAAMNAA
jgi:transposase